jgi:hypothetical protein
MGWIEDDEVSCVCSDGISSHALQPHSSSSFSASKLVVVMFREDLALGIELRVANNFDPYVSEGLLFYAVAGGKRPGFGPLLVLNPKQQYQNMVHDRGPELRNAAVKFSAKGS